MDLIKENRIIQCLQPIIEEIVTKLKHLHFLEFRRASPKAWTDSLVFGTAFKYEENQKLKTGDKDGSFSWKRSVPVEFMEGIQRQIDAASDKRGQEEEQLAQEMKRLSVILDVSDINATAAEPAAFVFDPVKAPEFRPGALVHPMRHTLRGRNRGGLSCGSKRSTRGGWGRYGHYWVEDI